ncbi:hypothetical protein J6590_100679, partial [Homalodisca vitripennis]
MRAIAEAILVSTFPTRHNIARYQLGYYFTPMFALSSSRGANCPKSSDTCAVSASDVNMKTHTRSCKLPIPAFHNCRACDLIYWVLCQISNGYRGIVTPYTLDDCRRKSDVKFMDLLSRIRAK